IAPGAYVIIRKDIKPNKLDQINDEPFKMIHKTKNGTYVLEDSTDKLLPRNYAPSQIISLSSDPQFTDNTYK
ncbi:hypothetical protein BB560_004866, partial [Smittium megazygosporum]